MTASSRRTWEGVPDPGPVSGRPAPHGRVNTGPAMPGPVDAGTATAPGPGGIQERSAAARLEAVIGSSIGGNLIRGSISIDRACSSPLTFRVRRMFRHKDVRGLSKAGIYVTRIATHMDVRGYIIHAYAELGPGPS